MIRRPIFIHIFLKTTSFAIYLKSKEPNTDKLKAFGLFNYYNEFAVISNIPCRS